MKIYNPTGFTSQLTGSFSGSVKGTFEGSFTGESLNSISGAFDSVSGSLASEKLNNTTDTFTGTLHVDGNVGIGTSSPTEGNLVVRNDSGNANINIKVNDFAGSSYTPSLDFSTGGQGANDPQAQIKAIGDNNYSAHLIFSTQNQGTTNPLVERFRITSTGNVGIGTSSPSTKLDVAGVATAQRLQVSDGGINITNIGLNTTSGGYSTINMRGASNRYSWEIGQNSQILNALTFTPSTALGGSTFSSPTVTFLQNGHVGIGATSPSARLTVKEGTNVDMEFFSESSGTAIQSYNRTSSTWGYFRVLAGGGEQIRVDTDGLKFNGDTAAANALDDYEEGTWTPTFNAAVTTSGNISGKYTKVGRLVYATCTFTYTALTGADISIGGLPFANAAIRQATATAFSGVARTTNQFFGTLVDASANNFYIEVLNSASGVSFTAHASCWYQVS